MKILVIDSSPYKRLVNLFNKVGIKFNSDFMIISFSNTNNKTIKAIDFSKRAVYIIILTQLDRGSSAGRFKNFLLNYINYNKVINYIFSLYKPNIIYSWDLGNLFHTYIYILKLIGKLKVKLVANWYDKNSIIIFDKIFNSSYSIFNNFLSIINEFLAMFSCDYILYCSDNFKSIFNKFNRFKKINAIKIIPPVDAITLRPYPKDESREVINNIFNQKIFSKGNHYILFFMGGNFDYYFQLKSIILLRKYLDKKITVVVKSPGTNSQIEKLKAYFQDNLVLIDKYIDKKIMPYFISSFDLAIYISDKRVLNENFRYPYRMLECLACGLSFNISEIILATSL